ncbi:MAG: fluoroacetyl-CoA thioesterase [Verrucomicrobiota bacterium]
MTEPASGDVGRAELVVQQSDCASDLNVGNAPEGKFPAVFATTRMIALREMAGARFLKLFLQEGEVSVGVTVDIIHSAATPIGAKVTVTATYRGRDGKLFIFDVAAHDPGGEIGRGTHKRAIISRERSLAGAAKRSMIAGDDGEE